MALLTCKRVPTPNHDLSFVEVMSSGETWPLQVIKIIPRDISMRVITGTFSVYSLSRHVCWGKIFYYRSHICVWVHFCVIVYICWRWMLPVLGVFFWCLSLCAYLKKLLNKSFHIYRWYRLVAVLVIGCRWGWMWCFVCSEYLWVGRWSILSMV